jgi:hypothetical protein
MKQHRIISDVCVLSCYPFHKDTLHEIHGKNRTRGSHFIFSRGGKERNLTEMSFFLNDAVFREGKHRLALKWNSCCHGNIRNKAREERDHMFSMRHCELLITQKESDTADIV